LRLEFRLRLEYGRMVRARELIGRVICFDPLMAADHPEEQG